MKRLNSLATVQIMHDFFIYLFFSVIRLLQCPDHFFFNFCYFSSPFSLSPPVPPALPQHQVERWACPKLTPPVCRMSTSSLLSLDSTAQGETFMTVIIDPLTDIVDSVDNSDDRKSAPTHREELGIMSCDDISRYSVSSQSGSKGSETVSYYLDQDSGQFFSLLEGDVPPGTEYDRCRNTGIRWRDKTPTHGKRKSVLCQCEWGSNGCVCFIKKHVLRHLTVSLHGSAVLCFYLIYMQQKNQNKKLITLESMSALPPVETFSETASKTSFVFLKILSRGLWCSRWGSWDKFFSWVTVMYFVFHKVVHFIILLISYYGTHHDQNKQSVSLFRIPVLFLSSTVTFSKIRP